MTPRHLAALALLVAIAAAGSVTTAGLMAHTAAAVKADLEAARDRSEANLAIGSELGEIRVQIAVMQARADLALGR